MSTYTEILTALEALESCALDSATDRETVAKALQARITELVAIACAREVRLAYQAGYIAGLDKAIEMAGKNGL